MMVIEKKKYYVHGSYMQGNIYNEDCINVCDTLEDAEDLARNQLPVWDSIIIYYGSEDDYDDNMIKEVKEY